MFGVLTRNIRLGMVIVAILAVAACTGREDPDRVIAATPFAITIETSRVGDPTAQAEAHCAQYNRKAVARGGIEVGDPVWKIMWGFDCVDP